MSELESSTILTNLLTDMITALVSRPEDVDVVLTEGPGTSIFTVDVALEDRGKIIGRGGVIIESMKTIFNALGCKHQQEVFIKIQE